MEEENTANTNTMEEENTTNTNAMDKKKWVLHTFCCFYRVFCSVLSPIRSCDLRCRLCMSAKFGIQCQCTIHPIAVILHLAQVLLLLLLLFFYFPSPLFIRQGLSKTSHHGPWFHEKQSTEFSSIRMPCHVSIVCTVHKLHAVSVPGNPKFDKRQLSIKSAYSLHTAIAALHFIPYFVTDTVNVIVCFACIYLINCEIKW